MRVSTLNNVRGHEGRRIIVTLEQALSQVTLQLQTKQVARELFLQLRGVRRVELYAEPYEGIHERQPYLPG